MFMLRSRFLKSLNSGLDRGMVEMNALEADKLCVCTCVCVCVHACIRMHTCVHLGEILERGELASSKMNPTQ